jgi:hypothetical protein
MMYGKRGLPESGKIAGIFSDIEKVDAVAIVLTNAIQQCQTSDGRLDEEDLGGFVLRCMAYAGGDTAKFSLSGDFLTVKESAEFKARVADMLAAKALGKLIIEAIENTQESNGFTDTKKVAVYLLRKVKEASQ